jgi:hypothetical protein
MKGVVLAGGTGKLAPTNFTSKLALPPAPSGKHCGGDETQKEGDPHLVEASILGST